jgi:putative flippase GtrA
MTDQTSVSWEAGMAIKFGAVGLLGLCVDAALLRIGVGVGMTPAIARIISLFCAMQVTFAINGLHVFRCLERGKWLRQWAGYMTANGLGNLCNYWIFVTLISTHWPIASNHYVALLAGSFAAYLINYGSTRLLVFGKGRAATLQAVRRRRMQSVCAFVDPEPLLTVGLPEPAIKPGR